ncbi:hypothetical protein [Nannocystis sp.]|uniref:hypothetical protein n=1 Tax=Nannocystis sp. TaxID=1962667 RepID=UPI0024254B13|nr:hypothetical protein [Nannocystis sp.]MBK7830263.1 hypothetical protein [Nannocystis sp.]MBK9752233.1 hypothetical protein [Nannocystis sp.]
MRGLRKAVYWGVFAVLAGCNYENPGFKVKGSDDGAGASETGVSVSGASEASVSGVPTTGEPPDSTTGPGTSVTTTTGVAESSGGEVGSTGDPPPKFPAQCGADNRERVDFVVAADTYFYFNVNDIGQCEDVQYPCKDTSAGLSGYQNVFNRDGYMSFFVVRFEPQAVEYMGYKVPADVVTLTLQMFIENLDDGIPGDVILIPKRLAPEDKGWPEGDNYGLEECTLGDSSYACRKCKANTSCAEEWVMPIGDVVASPMVVGDALAVETPLDGAMKDMAINASTELALLAKGHPGFLIMAEAPVYEGTLIIKSKDTGDEMYTPRLFAEFCRPD